METNEKNDYFDFFNEVDQDLWWSFKDADSSEEHEEMELALGSNKRQKLQKYRSYRFDNNKEITRAVPRHIKNYRTRHGLDHTRQTRDKRKPRQLASTPEAIELMYDSDESTIME